MQIVTTLSNDTQLPLALSIGNFDGVHVGHQAILNKLLIAANTHGLTPSVMTFSPHAKVFFANKENFLITSDNEKADLIAKTGVQLLYQIPFNSEFSNLSPLQFIDKLINQLHVKYLLIGDDFRFGYKGQGGFELLLNECQKHDITVINTPTIKYNNQRLSSSSVRDAINNSNFSLINKLLGRPLRYAGTVINGKKLGRTINFPTANIRLPDTRILPSGVFAVKIIIEGNNQHYYGMCNIGTKPTVDDLAVRQIEVNIFDFSQDLYGKKITLEPISKLRDEQKFDSFDALVNQLHQDKRDALATFSPLIK